MPADNTARLIDSARRRHELTRAKAIRTLRELDRAGTPVTFELVARTAEVSRSWLYSQPDIRDQIQQLRDTARRSTVIADSRQPARVGPIAPAAAAGRLRTQPGNSPRTTGGSAASSPKPSASYERSEHAHPSITITPR